MFLNLLPIITVERLIDGAMHHFGACYIATDNDDENDTKQPTQNTVTLAAL